MNARVNPPDPGRPAGLHAGVDRRTVLKSLAAAGALAVPGLGIAACGGSATSSTNPAIPKIKKGGTLRVALSGGSSSDTLDAQSAITTVDFARIFRSTSH
jgi:peptide/nickel transport system substrate-binding protein